MEGGSWNDLRVLLAVYRAGSLAGAGQKLGVSTSTTGRRLDALEQVVGKRLVHRTQTGTELTPAALHLVRLAEELENGIEAHRRDQELVAGTIRISVPDGLALTISKALFKFQLEYSSINVEVIGESRLVDVAKREADMAVRLTRSTSNFLVEKKLATLRFGLYASTDYIRRNLPTRRINSENASLHPFVGLDPRWSELPQEKWMVELGATRFIFRSSSIEAVAEAVQQGIGVAALPEQIGNVSGLIRIDTKTAGPIQPLYIVYHRDLRASPHLRAALSSIEISTRGLR